MHYLSVENLTKSYGIQPLFNNIGFHINEGDRVSLVARNGTGKSTLLNIITGKEYQDSGKVWVNKDVKVVFLAQQPDLDFSKNVLDNIFHYKHPILELVKNYEDALLKNDGPLITQLMIQMDEQQAWNFENKVHQILSKLKIDYLTQSLTTLSGGQLKRLALARTLIDIGFDNTHTLLLLDEPTNHLDFGMIEWLEHYIVSEKMTLILVTHDRYFLDNVCTTILELENGVLSKFEGNYNYFLGKKAEREIAMASELEKDRNIYRRELEWVRKQPKARTVKSKSRVDAFEDIKANAMKRKVQLEMELQVKMTRIGGKTIEIKKLGKSFNGKLLFQNFDYAFKRKERVGIVGPNGAGKSTFLNIIQHLETADIGKVNIGETVVLGYYNQVGLILKEDKRVIEFVKDIAEHFPLADGTKVSASQFLQRFLFEPEKHFTYISKLSGGERRRLHLLSLLYKNPNFLILDEPTNDLDLPTLSILEEFLLHFEGCVIIVSHDRYFMDKLVDHLFVFDGKGKINDFPGNYTEYRNYLKDTVLEDDFESALGLESENEVMVEPIKPKQQLNYRDKKEFETIEKDLRKMENEKKQIEDKLANELPLAEIQQLSNRLGEILKLTATKEMRWLELSELMSTN
jgi:ATP-binding cassette subfamily F protein uup